MKYRFLSVALEELTSVVGYYHEISPELAREFLDEIDAAIQRIKAYPSAWQKLSNEPGVAGPHGSHMGSYTG